MSRLAHAVQECIGQRCKKSFFTITHMSEEISKAYASQNVKPRTYVHFLNPSKPHVRHDVDHAVQGHPGDVLCVRYSLVISCFFLFVLRTVSLSK